MWSDRRRLHYRIPKVRYRRFRRHVKVKHESIRSQPVCVGARYVDADADGVLDVTDEEADRLLTIPGFTLVDESEYLQVQRALRAAAAEKAPPAAEEAAPQ